MVTRSEPGYRWDFCGGELSIDFTNTVGSRGGVPEEHLSTYGDLLSWAEARGVIGRADAQRLRREAARHPAAAREALTDAVAFREALYRVIAATVSGHTPGSADLSTINSHVGESFSGARLHAVRGRLELAHQLPGRSPLVEPILHPVSRAATNLLTGA